MKTYLTILGCGSSFGVPRIDGRWGKCDKKNIKNIRTRCSVLIRKGLNFILIDTSPDLRAQLLKNNIKNISSVLYTHHHADQTHGINELRPFFWKNKKKINIYANKFTINFLKKAFNYCFNGAFGYKAILKDNLVKKNFSLGSKSEKIYFKSISVQHGPIKSLGYIFEKAAYISDCNSISRKNMKNLKNLNFLIIDCLRIKKHPSHFNLKESLYIHNCLKPKKTILTNLHHDLDYDFLQRGLPNNVFPAYDGLKLSL